MSTDDTRTNAIYQVAASIVARAADTEIRDSREQYADIGEHDWAAIAAAVYRIAPWPDPVAVEDAEEYLARRARGTEATDD